MADQLHSPVTLLVGPIHCAGCGYSLSGLAQSGVCPECATPIAWSRLGYFRSGDPGWIANLYVGARSLQIGMLAASIALSVFVAIALFVIAALLLPRLSQWEHSDAAFGAVCITIIPLILATGLLPLGSWLVTTRPPKGSALRLRDRALFRWSTLGIATIVVGAFAISMLEPMPRWSNRGNLDIALALFAGVLVLVSLSAQGSYIADLALLIPDQRIHRRTRLLRWLTPVLLVPAFVGVFAVPWFFVAMVGPLIASVLFALLYSRLARVLYDCKEAAWLNSRTPRPPPPVV